MKGKIHGSKTSTGLGFPQIKKIVAEREADGNAKKMDEWHLHEIITEMIAAADRPATASVHGALDTILQWQFDFCKRISANVEVLKAKNTKVKAFGLEAKTAQLVLTMMANVKPVAEHNYGQASPPPSKQFVPPSSTI